MSGARTRSEPDLAKTFAEPDYDDGSWTRVVGPAPLARRSRRSPTTTDRCCTGGVSPTPDAPIRTADRPTGVGSSSSTASSTTATCGSTASTSARPRATSRRTRSRSREPLRERDEHVLAIEVACPPQRDRTAKRTITGGYWQSPVFDRALNPGGIWRPVRLASSGPVRIDARACVCTDASVERGRLACNVTLDAGDRAPRRRICTRSCAARTAIVLLDAWRTVTLATGTNELAWTLTVDDAAALVAARARPAAAVRRSSSTSRSTASSSDAFSRPRRVPRRAPRRFGAARSTASACS